MASPVWLFYKSENGCRLGKSAVVRIARLKNSLAKGPKKNGDKSAVAMLKKHELYDRTGKPVVGGQFEFLIRAKRDHDKRAFE